MNPDTGFAIGLILISLGVLVIAGVRSLRAERAARRRTNQIVRVSRAAVVTPQSAGGIDELWLELLTTPHVPAQRRPGGGS